MLIKALHTTQFLSIVFASIFLAAMPSSANDAASKEKSPPIVVVVEKATPVELADEITYPARLVSKVNATVNADVDGVVVQVLQAIGHKVSTKSALFRIKNTDPVYEYVPVTVSSPVAGIISSVDVAEGTMVKRGQQLATVTDPTQIRVTVEIAASDLASIQSGLKGEMTLNNRAPLGVRVIGVSPLVDPATGTAPAELAISDNVSALPALPVGMIGRVAFKVNRRQGLQVPEQALVLRGDATFLRLATQHPTKSKTKDSDARRQAKMIPVKVVATHRGMSEISSGLKAGDLVIVRTSGFVAEGQDVTIQEEAVATK